MSVRSGIQRDLDTYEKRLPGIKDSGLGQAALELADRMDDPDNSATAVSNCARSLQDIMIDIRASLPPADSHDGVDELLERREQRRRAG